MARTKEEILKDLEGFIVMDIQVQISIVELLADIRDELTKLNQNK